MTISAAPTPGPTAPLPPAPPASAQTIDALHRDLAFANGYRMELIRTLLAIAAALFAFTVTFGPTLKPVECKPAMWIGWLGLALSMFGGFVHLLGWDHYYKSYLDFDWRDRNKPDRVEAAKAARDARARINLWRRWGMGAQFAGFVVGVAGVGAFAGVNLEHAAPRSDPIVLSCCADSPHAASAAVSRAASSAPPRQGWVHP